MSSGILELGPHELDRALAAVANSRGMIELALGEALARLFDCGGLPQLGYARQTDYARERLGVPPRTMYGWVRLARVVAGRPLLRRAVCDGSATPRKALAVAPLAVADEEQRWVETAARLPLTELESLAQAHGAGAVVGVDARKEGYGNVESLILRMTPEQQKRVDEAIELAQSQNGYEMQRWQCVEAICQEWLGTFGAWEPLFVREAEIAPPALASTSAAPTVARQLRVVRLAHRMVAPYEPPHELDARIQQLLVGRREYDLAFGELAARASSTRVWREVGYPRLEEYCRERLGVSARSFRERVWLERRMCALPILRNALERGVLTYSKALLVAKDATASDVEDRIADAAERTWQQTERESTQREDRRNLAAGIRRIWGPEDIVRTVVNAVASAKSVAKASGLGEIDSGGALALIAEHFLKVWKVHGKRRAGRRRREVLLRSGGLCAVPGCSRPAQHEHHIEYRSCGGTDDAANLVGLCAVHHLQGVHRGRLRVSGRAGERLEWEFGNGERWITVGADSVTRLVDRTGERAAVG